MKVAIRADGSPFIGMGHVMRMLALAEAFQRLGHEVMFLSRFEPGLSRIRSQGFAVHQVVGGLPDGVGKDYEPSADTEAVCRILLAEQFDCLVTDSYRVDVEYFRQVRPLVLASFYIDDLNRFPVEVDGVVNGNINAKDLGYDTWPTSVNCWLGCQYNLLRPEFTVLPERETSNHVGNLLIIAGGGDVGPLLVMLASALLDLAKQDKFILQLVAPTQSVADPELMELAMQHPMQVRIHRGVTQMAALMQQCDLAISAGGSTLYELCAAGVPRLAFVLAANQQGIVDTMVRRELAVSLGAVADLNPLSIGGAVTRLAADWLRRDRQNHQGKILVDGQGTLRVVQEIEKVVAAAAEGGTYEPV